MVIHATLATFNDVIDDEPAGGAAAKRAAVQSRALITVPFEHDRTHALPSLRAIKGIVYLRTLARRGLPSWRSKRRWFCWHACARPWVFRIEF
jgi:hypothetical protein